jgi:glyoxalase family protein
MRPIKGIHHVTAISGDPQRNIDFYVTVLGQRLVKTTVNFDDPGTYHLYYGDEVGSPGTILTFFPWPHAKAGRPGSGEAGATAYVIPDASVGFWLDRLARHGVPTERTTRFGEPVIGFADPDGMRVELIATAGVPDPRHWTAGPVPAEHALRGFHGFSLNAGRGDATAALLAGPMGLTLVAEEGNRRRFRGDGDVVGQFVDVVDLPDARPGSLGRGSVHHVAFRAEDDSDQAAAQAEIRGLGFNVTDVLDRRYFRSIYFREPSHSLFEIATVAPGFTLDEPAAELGHSLKLPPFLEPQRSRILQLLPPVTVPEVVPAAPGAEA